MATDWPVENSLPSNDVLWQVHSASVGTYTFVTSTNDVLIDPIPSEIEAEIRKYRQLLYKYKERFEQWPTEHVRSGVFEQALKEQRDEVAKEEKAAK